MALRLIETITVYWERSKAFRVATTVAFLVLLAVPFFLLIWHTRVLLGYSFSVLLIFVRLAFGYISCKQGYVEQFKQSSPKSYYYTRRVELIVGSGLFTAFAIMLLLSELFGPLLSLYSVPLFLALIVVGAVIGDWIGRKTNYSLLM